MIKNWIYLFYFLWVALLRANTPEWSGRILTSGIGPTSLNGKWIQKNIWASNQINYSLHERLIFNSKIFYTYSDSPYSILPKDPSGEFSKVDISELELITYPTPDKVKFLIGKSVVKWGKMDGPSPLDVYKTKRNFLQNPDSYWQDRGQYQTQLKILKLGESHWSLDFNYSWRGEAVDLTLPKNKIPLNLELEREKKDSSFLSGNHREESAFKLSYTGELQDFELVGFHGYEHQTLLKQEALVLVGTTPLIILAPLHLKKDLIGMGWSRALEHWILRAEAAHVMYEKNNNLLYQSINQSHFSFGAERSIGDELRFIIETHYTKQEDRELNAPSNSIITDALRNSNRSIIGPLKEDRLGFMLHGFYQQENVPEWKYELSSMTYAGDNAGFIGPAISYEWFSGLKSQMFAQIYWGDNASPLGQLKELNSLGLSLEYFY